jgi:RNA polymerase sigma-70 factor (ECF subfamily)
MSDLDAHLPGIVAGDATAYARWLAGAEPRLRASLRSFAAHVDTESVLQECLLRAWQVAPKLVPDGRADALLRLAIRMARNLAVDEMRRLRVRPTIVATLAESPLEPALVPADPDPILRKIIAACRELLPRMPAQALDARLSGSGRADRELAAELGLRTNTFLQNFGRARRLLAECLARHGIDVEALR